MVAQSINVGKRYVVQSPLSIRNCRPDDCSWLGAIASGDASMHALRVQPPMLTGLDWLALEVKALEPAREFYAERLGLAIREQRSDELVFAAGGTDLVCRRPDSLPRGGLHTHYAFSIPAGEYDDWWDRLAAASDLEEARFGSARSLYLYDPDGNCVELGQRDVAGPGIDGIFEVVLEVERLERAREFYEDLASRRSTGVTTARACDCTGRWRWNSGNRTSVSPTLAAVSTSISDSKRTLPKRRSTRWPIAFARSSERATTRSSCAIPTVTS